MPPQVTTSDVLSGLAFLLSIYATWKTIQFNNRQQSLIESQELLNKRMLEKEDAESIEAKKAALGATLLKFGSSNYKLRVFNRGPAAARNVNLKFLEGNDFVMVSDKFPMELLERHQSVDLIAAVSLDTKSKHPVRLTWDDDFKSNNEKLVYVTL